MDNWEGKLPLRDILTETFIFGIAAGLEIENIVPDLKAYAKDVC
jgi:hypothetical protein